jgi:DNA polymerase III subunit delta
MTQRQPKKNPDNKFDKHTSQGSISPVYVFTGDQIYLIEKAVSLLKESTLGPTEDINYVVFHGDTATGNEIADTASTYPMFTEKKLVVVKNAQKLKTGDLEILDSYIASPCGSTCLALVFLEGKKPKLKNKKRALFFDFSLDRGDTLSSTTAIAGSLGYELTRRGAETLISLVGEDLQDIQNELMKLSLYSLGKKKIDEADIKALTKKSSFENVFSLINAISKRNKRQALGVLSELEARGEEPLSVLGRISWRFRQIWKCKELVDKKVPKAEILKSMKMSSGAFYYLSEDQKKFSYGDIVRIMSALGECDKKLKISYASKNHTLTKLVLELCS